MTTLIVTALVSAFLPAAAPSAPFALDEAPAGQQTIGVAQGTMIPRKPWAETLRGTIDRIDQGSNTISIRLSPESTVQFKVQDGLLFDVARYGDQVEVTVQNIGGARTIVGVSKE